MAPIRPVSKAMKNPPTFRMKFKKKPPIFSTPLIWSTTACIPFSIPIIRSQRGYRMAPIWMKLLIPRSFHRLIPGVMTPVSKSIVVEYMLTQIVITLVSWVKVLLAETVIRSNICSIRKIP